MASQSDYRVTATLVGVELAVTELKLTESLSTPFQLLLDVYQDHRFGRKLPEKGLIDKIATVTLWEGRVEKRHVHGIIENVYEGTVGRRFQHFQITVGPELNRLQLTANCRIFQ